MTQGAVVLAIGLYTVASTSAVSPVATIKFAPKVEVHKPLVELQDIADLSSVPQSLKRRIAALPVARFGVNQDRMTFTTTSARERVRALVPALGPWLPRDEASAEIVVRFTRASNAIPASPMSATGCRRTIKPISSGTFPTTDDFEPVRCGEMPARPLAYDSHTGVVRAERDIALGEIVAAVPNFALAGIQPGQQIYIEATVGPVKVRRALKAVQPVRRGQAFFAQASDGAVISVPYPGGAQ
jgi:hypothetical protein